MQTNEKRIVFYLFEPPNNLRLNHNEKWEPYTDSKSLIRFSDKLVFEKWRPNECLLDLEDTHWKDWLGTIFWDELTKEEGIVSLSYLSTNDEDQIHEQELANKIHRAFASFRLAYPFRPAAYYKSKMLIGKYKGTVDNYKITKIDSIQPQASYVDPYYARNSNKDQTHCYYGNFQRNDVLNEAVKIYQRMEHSISLFKEYCEENNCMERLSYDPSQIWNAIYAFGKALQNTNIGFIIPTYIRGIDNLICLRQGETQKDFAHRIISFLPKSSFNSPYYKNIDLYEQLITLYRIRNDSFHGKNWDYTFRMKKKRSITKEELARLSFIAEDILRLLIKKFLYSDELLKVTHSRSKIEKYW